MGKANEFARAFLTKEEYKRAFSNGKRSGNKNKGLVQRLRREKEMSQADLMSKLGVSRRFMHRVENADWKKMTIEEMELLAYGFDTEGIELYRRLSYYENGENGKSENLSPKNPFFVTDFVEGIRLASYARKPDLFFIGGLTLSPHISLTSDLTEKAMYVFFCVLKGDVVLLTDNKEKVLRRGSCFSFESGQDYEIYNPSQMYDATLMFFSYPSII